MTKVTRIHFAALALVLAAFPLADGHATPVGGGGTAKDYCEVPFFDTASHDYATGTGFLVSPAGDGAIPPCPFDDGTWDGHYEFAYGGAQLQAAASVCTEAYADHAQGSLIAVHDTIYSPLGFDVTFSVYADTLNNNPIPEEPNCGDFETDYGVDCVNACAPGFPPGMDGAYTVYVSGTYGHVYTGASEEGFGLSVGALALVNAAAGVAKDHGHFHYCPGTLGAPLKPVVPPPVDATPPQPPMA